MRGISGQPFSLRIRGREYGYEDLVNLGMAPIVCVDAVATGATWLAAYSKKIRELDEKGAPR